MINVELGDGVRGKVHIRTLLYVKLKHVCLLEGNRSLD